MRAAAAELIRSAAQWRRRALDPIQALALAALVLLIAWPSWSVDLGFQLSCAATLGLVTLGPALSAMLGRAAATAAPFVPTLAAQTLAMPILLGRFHAFSWVAPFANLLAVPISGLLLTATWIAVALDLLAPGLGGLGFHAAEALAFALRSVTQVAAGVPAALCASGHDPAIPALAAIAAALLALAAPPARDLAARRRPDSSARVAAFLLGAFLGALAFALAVTVPPLRPRPDRVWVIVLDVGQGDAIALGLADGWWLVDAGARSPHFDAGESVVLPFLRWAGVRRLERLILTHDDGDHTGGAAAVRRGVRVGRVLAAPALPGVPGPGSRFGATAVARGARLDGRGAVRVLWPPDPASAAGRAEPITRDNAAGVVLEIAPGRCRALLAADVDSTIERALDVAPGLTLLKVAHHGSGSSSGAWFLAHARPRIAAISCGRRNPFGHPDAGALARLAHVGARIDRTDREGALWYELDRYSIRRVDWRRESPGREAHVTPTALPPFAAR